MAAEQWTITPPARQILRRTLQCFIAATLVAGIVEVRAALLYPVSATVNFLFDDAYYYLGVAQHIARGAGSKFREPLFTNGYQPLWLWLLSLISAAFALSKHGLFVCTVALVYLVKLWSLCCCARTRASDELLLIGVGVAFGIVRSPAVFSYGMETTLLLAVAPALPWLLRERDDEAWLRGAMFAGLFLIRLDMGAIFLAHALLRLHASCRVDRALRVQTSVVVAVALSYFTYNQLEFGTAVPVSGLAKSLGNHVGENAKLLKSYLFPLCTVVPLLALGFFTRGTLKARALYRRPLAVFGLTLVIVASYYALFSGWPVWGWYHWPSDLLFIFACADVTGTCALVFSSRARLVRWQAVVAYGGPTLLGLGGAFLVAICIVPNNADWLAAVVHHEDFARSWRARPPVRPGFSERLRDFVNIQARGREHYTVLMGDGAGQLAYWMDDAIHFIHLEGLVGSKEFIDARRRGEGEEFVERFDPDLYIVGRGDFLHADGAVGVAEPVQGLSAHAGVMLFCLPESALQQQHEWLYALDFRSRTECSRPLRSQLDRLTRNYGRLRFHSMPTQYNGRLVQYLGMLPRF